MSDPGSSDLLAGSLPPALRLAVVRLNRRQKHDADGRFRKGYVSDVTRLRQVWALMQGDPVAVRLIQGWLIEEAKAALADPHTSDEGSAEAFARLKRLGALTPS